MRRLQKQLKGWKGCLELDNQTPSSLPTGIEKRGSGNKGLYKYDTSCSLL